MNFIKIVIVVVIAHLIFFAGLKLHDIVGTSDEAPGSSAGVDGLVNWSNQDPGADRPLVDSSKPVFDQRAGSLNGFNAGDPIVAANTSLSSGDRPRYAPRRPEGQSAQPASQKPVDSTVLQPIGQPQSGEKRYTPLSPLPKSIEYKVQAGDSLWGISKRFGTTVAEIKKANPRVSGSHLKVGSVLNIPRKDSSTVAASSTSGSKPITEIDGSVYVVKKGDSLSKIAARQGVTLVELMVRNRLKNDTIKIGQKLVIPKAKVRSDLADKQHKGQKVVMVAGDSLSKIAARYNVSVTDLMVYNNILEARKLPIGKVILIPEKATKRPAPVVRRSEPQPVRPAPRPVQNTPQPVRPRTNEPMPVLDSVDDDDLLDEDLIEQPVIPIVE